MAHSAFRFDLRDKGTVVAFTSQVGSLERLQNLFVLTCADLAAVGPGTLNDWKLNLIIQLYEATAAQFGDSKPDERFQDDLRQRREMVLKLIQKVPDIAWYREQLASVPLTYLFQNGTR